jgi:hypothetical protein
MVDVEESETVAQLLDAGWVVRVRSSVAISPAGREAHQAWARVESGSEAEAVAQRGYERFLALNTELIRVCHDWQVQPGNIPNDHRDARYDWDVIDRLRTLDERATPVVRRIGRDIERFDAYAGRLRGALKRVDNGEHDWFTSPRIDSYHTVWMQLHEDLLLALGLERKDET